MCLIPGDLLRPLKPHCGHREDKVWSLGRGTVPMAARAWAESERSQPGQRADDVPAIEGMCEGCGQVRGAPAIPDRVGGVVPGEKRPEAGNVTAEGQDVARGSLRMRNPEKKSGQTAETMRRDPGSQIPVRIKQRAWVGSVCKIQCIPGWETAILGLVTEAAMTAGRRPAAGERAAGEGAFSRAGTVSGGCGDTARQRTDPEEVSGFEPRGRGRGLWH